jgi:GTP 3',8-cyclase
MEHTAMDTDGYQFDSHKLMYHISRVNEWLNGNLIYPIYIEISPSGTCNHRCTFCAFDFMEYQKRYIDTKVLKASISEMAEKGVKSIMYAGEGEPFLHPDMADIAKHTKESGIDVAITSNGVLMTPAVSDKTLEYLEWIKVSINAGKDSTYSKIHNTNKKDFDKVIKNMSYAANIKNKKNLQCVLGMQCLLLPENFKEIGLLAQIAKDIGMDYLVVKPFSQNPLSKSTQYKDIQYNSYMGLYEELSGYNSESFKIIFREYTMKKWDQKERCYQRCLALPFWTYIDAGGSIWGCAVFLNKDKFLYGNLYEQTFEDIWLRNKQKKEKWLEENWDVSKCRVNCRMDEINRYLWKLKHPAKHVNFI